LTLNQNTFPARLDMFLMTLRRKEEGSFKTGRELNGAVGQKDGDAINDGVSAAAALALYCAQLKLQDLMAHGAGDPTQVLCCQCLWAHRSILARERDTMEKMTTTPRILDGIAIAGQIKAEVAAEVQTLAAKGIIPGLAVILVGEVPASQIYVRSKVKACGELGIFSELIKPRETVTTDELLSLVAALNAREDIDGILVQLPLPRHVDAKRVLDAVFPSKDVDGLHPMNAGLLQSGRPALAPCTPAGIIEILKRTGLPMAGQNAVVVGRSDLAGKPAAMLLLAENATVTICHSRTRDLPGITRNADILVAAIGIPGYIAAEMVKPGAVLIDVGINRITDAAEVERFFPGDPDRAATFAKRGSVVVGDIHPAAFEVAGAYTPVPGGVGALTIAMLMQNTVTAAKLRRGTSTEKR
jgi:methylenetetrahydrofolate dehydrogenase (NADP+)/methenyltetrahydrofolate cyclohydrolase